MSLSTSAPPSFDGRNSVDSARASGSYRMPPVPVTVALLLGLFGALLTSFPARNFDIWRHLGRRTKPSSGGCRIRPDVALRRLGLLPFLHVWRAGSRGRQGTLLWGYRDPFAVFGYVACVARFLSANRIGRARHEQPDVAPTPNGFRDRTRRCATHRASLETGSVAPILAGLAARGTVRDVGEYRSRVRFGIVGCRPDSIRPSNG